jgi:hypothetical protein
MVEQAADVKPWLLQIAGPPADIVAGGQGHYQFVNAGIQMNAQLNDILWRHSPVSPRLILSISQVYRFVDVRFSSPRVERSARF